MRSKNSRRPVSLLPAYQHSPQSLRASAAAYSASQHPQRGLRACGPVKLGPRQVKYVDTVSVNACCMRYCGISIRLNGLR